MDIKSACARLPLLSHSSSSKMNTPKVPAFLNAPISGQIPEDFELPQPLNMFVTSPFQFVGPFTWTFDEPRSLYIRDGRFGTEISFQINRVEESWFRAMLRRMTPKFNIDTDVKTPTYSTKTQRIYLNIKFKKNAMIIIDDDAFSVEQFQKEMLIGNMNAGQSPMYKPMTEVVLEPYVWLKHVEDGIPSINMTLYLKQVKV